MAPQLATSTPLASAAPRRSSTWLVAAVLLAFGGLGAIGWSAGLLGNSTSAVADHRLAVNSRSGSAAPVVAVDMLPITAIGGSGGGTGRQTTVSGHYRDGEVVLTISYKPGPDNDMGITTQAPWIEVHIVDLSSVPETARTEAFLKYCRTTPAPGKKLDCKVPSDE